MARPAPIGLPMKVPVGPGESISSAKEKNGLGGFVGGAVYGGLSRYFNP